MRGASSVTRRACTCSSLARLPLSSTSSASPLSPLHAPSWDLPARRLSVRVVSSLSSRLLTRIPPSLTAPDALALPSAPSAVPLSYTPVASTSKSEFAAKHAKSQLGLAPAPTYASAAVIGGNVEEQPPQDKGSVSGSPELEVSPTTKKKKRTRRSMRKERTLSSLQVATPRSKTKNGAVVRGKDRKKSKTAWQAPPSVSEAVLSEAEQMLTRCRELEGELAAIGTPLEKAIHLWTKQEAAAMEVPEWTTLSTLRQHLLRDELYQVTTPHGERPSRLESWAKRVFTGLTTSGRPRKFDPRNPLSNKNSVITARNFYVSVRRLLMSAAETAKGPAIDLSKEAPVEHVPTPRLAKVLEDGHQAPPHLQASFLAAMDDSGGPDKFLPTSARQLARRMYRILPSSLMGQLAFLDTFAHTEGAPETEAILESKTYPLVLSSDISITSLSLPGPPVPIAKLAHGLERVLFNPGVHFLKDPRTSVYNFPPFLENLPRIAEFEFEKLPRYVTASQDENLARLATEHAKKFVGSTSSTTAMLCQIYFWLSGGKPVNLSMLGQPWSSQRADFSMGQRLPASIIMHERDGHYAIDADKSMDLGLSNNVLSSYGHLMEKLLTTEPHEFSRFLVGSEDPAPSLADERQAYHYMQTENLVLRSQLDAHHELLPNVTFDVKTRATVAIRQDRLNYEAAAGYEIDKLKGEFNSFEREYYDLIRSAFLKYQFQARIGAMDGILVAHHTTAAFCGFSYIPIEEMDEALFDSPHGDRTVGDHYFRACIAFLDRILSTTTQCYPNQSLKVTFAADTSDAVPNGPLQVFVEPLEESPTLPAITLLELRTNFDGNSRDIAYSLTTRTSPSRIEAATGPDDVANLLWGVRQVQRMFNSIALPDDVDLAELTAAQQAAELDGGQLEPSSLAARFPAVPGLEYRTRASRGIRVLRRLAKQGNKAKSAVGEKLPAVELRTVIHHVPV